MSASAVRANLLVALGYVALAGLVMVFFELPAPMWPSTGLAVFAILAGGWRWVPGIALGSWLANDFLLGWSTVGALWVTLGNVLGPVLGMVLFRQVVADWRRPFETATGVGAFFLLLGGLNGAVSAVFGATGTAFIEGHGEAVLAATFMRWAVGDASSAVLLAPAFFLWWRDPRLRPPSHGWIEAIVSAGLLLGITAWAFLQPAPNPLESGLVPLILLPLVWVALRASQRDAYTLIAVVFLIMLAGTLLGRGPFAALGPELALTTLQLRIVVLGAVVLLASALEADRRRTMQALAELNAHLEERVAERTRLIEASRERLRQIVESLPSPMVMSRAKDGLLVEINEAAAQSLGFSRGELLGARTVDFYVDPDEREALMATLQSQGIARQHELRIRHPDGRILWLLVSAALMPDSDEALILFTFQDITPVKQREHELERLAAIDGLTGALNRRQFMLEAGQRLREGALHVSPLAMLILDLDHFKQVNDTRGHLAGDEVLRQVSATVMATLRHQDLFGRLGGEEFGVLLMDTDERGARELAERLRAAVDAMRIVLADGGTIHPTISIGGAQATTRVDEVPSTVDLLSRADRALYHAKSSGRNRVVFWQEDLPDKPRPA
jgi:diguanylate cyclase (GGDEF)-like protein/PAS domain S-box-containing protein